MARTKGAKNKLKVDKLIKNVPEMDLILDVARVGMSESMVKLMEAMHATGSFGEASLELQYKAAREVNMICRDLFKAEVEEAKHKALEAGYSEEELESDPDSSDEEVKEDTPLPPLHLVGRFEG